MAEIQKTVGFVSLGCDKNRVDTENMITTLTNYGFKVVSDPEKAQIIIINTCAFLKSARKEAFDNILQFAHFKQKNLEKLIVTGCLPLLNDQSMQDDMKDYVDAFVCPKDYDKLPQIIAKLYDKLKVKQLPKLVEGRILTTPSHYAYLKIADGCDNYCTYCRIPYIRGRFNSIPIEQVLQEAQKLVANGVRELIVVAQDVTRYGEDLYKESRLVDLLRQLSKIKKLRWIRLHYCYPERITQELIKEIASNPKIVKYIDIPMQHYSSEVLKRMNRKSSSQNIDKLIFDLRSNIPDIVIRSTFIVGFPGETKQQFKQLCEFLKTARLNNVGFFAYSREPGTASYNMDGQISDRIKYKRLKKIQKIQTKIALELNKQKLGKTYQIVCDGYDQQGGVYIGRSYASSPDVDFYTYFSSDNMIKVGEIVDVTISYVNKNFIYGETK